ncbi:hypothetical protein H8A97_30475 [Bradyrhizobium sp. Arg62]|uniref:hypothetical protein n=1 Tax=Bradyrhizobium brasilense TaxID=1419277 RepID=UPI001E4746A4|nr:hypothetical protein [Bradyrhizobium brasilense]MCC8949312.1 hypothetical protein [Bradyrhizobium brasilense]
MTGNRPRTFCWVTGVAGPAPQVVYDDPRVGCEGLQILASTRLEPTDTRSLTQLACDYPAPQESI